MNSNSSSELFAKDAFCRRPNASSFFPFQLVLGSRSPRRRRLLTNAGYRFVVLPAADSIEEREKFASKIDPTEFVSRLAFAKARDVVEQLQRGVVPRSSDSTNGAAPLVDRNDAKPPTNGATRPLVVLSCDSVAVCNGEILGKPRDRADAARMLRALSGSFHEVRTGLCLWSTPGDVVLRRVEISCLKMEKLSEERLESYLASGRWIGKAGAFGYQDGVDWLQLISGSESNVVGLPLEALAESLRELAEKIK